MHTREYRISQQPDEFFLDQQLYHQIVRKKFYNFYKMKKN